MTPVSGSMSRSRYCPAPSSTNARNSPDGWVKTGKGNHVQPAA